MKLKPPKERVYLILDSKWLRHMKTKNTRRGSLKKFLQVLAPLQVLVLPRFFLARFRSSLATESLEQATFWLNNFVGWELIKSIWQFQWYLSYISSSSDICKSMFADS